VTLSDNRALIEVGFVGPQPDIWKTFDERWLIADERCMGTEWGVA